MQNLSSLYLVAKKKKKHIQANQLISTFHHNYSSQITTPKKNVYRVQGQSMSMDDTSKDNKENKVLSEFLKVP